MDSMNYLDADLGDNCTKMDYLCRICLSRDTVDLVSLFDDSNSMNLSEKVLLCTNLKLYPIMGLPNEICKPCCDILTIADNFRSKCKDSDTLLRKMYPERFVDENKLDIKQLKSIDCNMEVDKETKLIKDDLNLEKECLIDNSNIESIPKRKKNLKRTTENLESCGLEIKEEKSDFLDAADIFDDDFSYEDDSIINLRKKSNKKSKKKKKNVTLSQETRNIENNIDFLVKQEKEENLDVIANIESTDTGKVDVEESKGKLYICAECGKPLSKRSSLRRHIQNMHSDEKKMSAATNSRKTGHGKDKRFHCPSCPYVTKFSQSLVYHERIHTGERPHKCPHCSRSFSQPGSLSCHLKTHSDKTYFTCASCGRQFKHKDSYEVHKLIHSEDRELFTCEICNTSLKSRKTLESHMNRHNNIKNYSCETCGLRFVTLVELINHSKKHNTDKKYKCNFCDFRTALKRSLQSHTKRHSNYRPFKCQSCDLSCFTKWELRNHEKTHTRESNYTCFVCQRKFIHSSSVNKHMQRTHGVKYQRNEDVDRRKVK